MLALAGEMAHRRMMGESGGAMRSLPQWVRRDNPAMALAGQLKIADARGDLDAKDLLRLGPRIQKTMLAGERDVRQVRAVLEELARLEAVPSRHVPAGF